MIDEKALQVAFNQVANGYDSVARVQREVGQRMLSRLDFMTMQPQRIIDLGAGTGYFTHKLTKRYRKANVIALDFAQAMMQYAKRKKSLLMKSHYLCADMHHIPLPDHSVDLIYSNCALQWSNHLSDVLREVQRVLMPEGLFMFTSMGPDTLKELRASWAAADNEQHVNEFIDMHDIGDLLLHCQFSDPVMDMEMIQLEYADINVMMRELKSLGAHNVLKQRQRTLTGKGKLQKMLTAYQSFQLANGYYPASYEIIYGHAWKTKESHTFVANEEGVAQIPVTKIKKT